MINLLSLLVAAPALVAPPPIQRPDPVTLTIDAVAAGTRTATINGLQMTFSDGPGFSDGLRWADGGLRGGSHIDRWWYWTAQFSLSRIPTGATILSATLSTNLDGHTGLTGEDLINGYAGTGTYMGFSGSCTYIQEFAEGPLGITRADATSFVKGLAARRSAYAAILVFPDWGNATGNVRWSSPKLTVVYALPKGKGS